MDAHNKCLYEFGSFRLDPAEHTLLHDGEVVHLTPKAFETLQLLVEHHGHLVEKDELMDELWEDTCVEEANVSKHISILRKVLSENGFEGPFIETIPKLGYRFVAPLREIEVEISPDGKAEIPDSATGQPTEPETSQSPFNLENVLNHARSHKLVTLLIFAALLTGMTAAGYYFIFSGNTPVLTDKDVILLIDFENKTGEEIFDGTLKQGLTMQLRQSPFLSVFPEGQVLRTLKKMKRPPDTRVTKEIGREICERQGLKALIAGTIVKFDRNYSLTLEAINSQTGETIALTQVEAKGKDQVLGSLSQAATEIRKKLGESLALIEKFDKPLPQWTTSSLEALKAIPMARKLRMSGKPEKAIVLFKRAIEIDPDFAIAYLALAQIYGESFRYDLQKEAIKKAYELREKVSESEKVAIEVSYTYNILGDINKSIGLLESQKNMYPRHVGRWSNLAEFYNYIGQYEQAITTSREALQINSRAVMVTGNLARSYVRLNRFDEAKELLERLHQGGYDQVEWHESSLYPIAFVQNDVAAMQKELDWFKGRPDEYRASILQAKTAVFRGQWKKSRDFFLRAIDLAKQKENEDAAKSFIVTHLFSAAILGQCAYAKELAGKAFTKDNQWPPTLSGVMPMCGEFSRAQSLLDAIPKKFGSGPLVRKVLIPGNKAWIELTMGKAKEAIRTLEDTRQFEHGEYSHFHPQYIRGQAYLKLNENEKAQLEFQKVLDHRGESPLSVLYPLAQLGKARATKDRREYEKFFEMWKDADPDLPILIEARREFRGLKPDQ